ncbi:CBS domain-containing protein [Azospirillum rugosum]|uniref:CBS domain-containing protein n=1 Tax=Azospirillum rugosum TaxID=416170 RepID=A0ABS4SFA1_9PROT|nr:CBS domain-containing protein [Azospirillum rugosum]MBP2291246.1 CBS domain-containing protein [Azospirillum rugosum]MDQ0524690.1 CBS domain-containing protein [Azospirillum rugosum]
MKAADIMTRQVITIDPDSTVTDAAQRMLENRISGLPVCDANGRLLGVISEGDLLRRAETGTVRRASWWLAMLAGAPTQAQDYTKSHGRRVRDVMSTSVVAANEDTPVEEVVRLMESHRIKRVPVLRDGRLVGIISRANLLHVLATIAPDVSPATADDGALRNRILETLRAEPWAPEISDNIVVRNGVVHLWGSVRTDAQRDALRVAAENTPGVKRVENNLVIIDHVAEGAVGF